MAEKTYYQLIQEMRKNLPHASSQEGVDPDVDVDEEPGLTDLDIEPDVEVDVPVQESAGAQERKTAEKGPGGSSIAVPGSGSSSKGGAYGGTTTGGTSGGKGGKLPPTRGTPVNLEEYENRMIAEYRNVGEKVVRDAHGDDAADDFMSDEDAQREFAEKAALQSFDEYIDDVDSEYKYETRTIGGDEVEVIVFADGSEYYVAPAADLDNLMPGDVIRIEPPASAR